jgi:hypothetical protein
MTPNDAKNKLPILLGIGFVAGIAIAAVDNFAFEGEVSPIVIVALLFATTATAGIVAGWRGWPMATATWFCLPFVHLIKHFFGLPDTLHPNTYTSILMLAAFTLVISAIGIGCGVLLRRFASIR